MAKNEEALLKKALTEGKVVIGKQQTMKLLKQGKIKKVYLASNCPDDFVQEVKHYSQLAKAVVVKLNRPNDELGIFCKKPFSVSVLGLK